MNIAILGSGCANCMRLESNVREVLAATGLVADVTKVTDYAEIAAYGVMSTPGFVVDGRVLVTGRVPSVAEVRDLLAAASV